LLGAAGGFGLANAYATLGPQGAFAIIFLTGLAIVVVQGAHGIGVGLKEHFYEKITGRPWREKGPD
jgi:hypothetical protein